jgi:COMPASS component BRE2
MSVEDSDRNIHFDPSTRIIANEKGWRLSRANVFAREGSLYYEVKILNGITEDPLDAPPGNAPQPHVRMGWARREAPLDAPVGFDGYSYAITDTRFDTMHRSRLGKFLPPKSKSKAKSKKAQAITAQTDSIPQEPLRTNDVVGLLITLPPLPLHRKVVAGTYNPAVDFSSAPDPNAQPPDVIRDRIPVPYRGNNYFEYFEYQPLKQMTAYSDRSPMNTVRPHPNHDDAPLRSLPGSSIKVYRNGVFVGTAFEDLMAFLPPASTPAPSANVRTGFDDGELGYYPAISLFTGGMAEMNFGPDFWHPPADLNLAAPTTGQDVEMGNAESSSFTGEEVMRPRPICDRYKEQIAEDVVWDIIDEAAFFAQDGGYNYVPNGGMLHGDVAGFESGGLVDL